MFQYEVLFEKIKQISVWEKEIIFESGWNQIYILRPEKQFKNYDVEKNFQIFLKTGDGREFRPNHLIIMLDLNLRVRWNSDTKRDLLLLFDAIFYKDDYSDFLSHVKSIKFEHFLYDISIISTLYILLLIEQDYNYPADKSKFNPATLFLHGWVRQFICNVKEIDNMTMSVCSRQPPLTQFTRQDNKKHKDFNENRRALWYFEEN